MGWFARLQTGFLESNVAVFFKADFGVSIQLKRQTLSGAIIYSEILKEVYSVNSLCYNSVNKVMAKTNPTPSTHLSTHA